MEWTFGSWRCPKKKPMSTTTQRQHGEVVEIGFLQRRYLLISLSALR